MVDSSATMVPLPLDFTRKFISTIKNNKSGKNDDEKTFNVSSISSSFSILVIQPIFYRLCHSNIARFFKHPLLKTAVNVFDSYDLLIFGRLSF